MSRLSIGFRGFRSQQEDGQDSDQPDHQHGLGEDPTEQHEARNRYQQEENQQENGNRDGLGSLLMSSLLGVVGELLHSHFQRLHLTLAQLLRHLPARQVDERAVTVEHSLEVLAVVKDVAGTFLLGVVVDAHTDARLIAQRVVVGIDEFDTRNSFQRLAEVVGVSFGEGEGVAHA